jgi:magnesium-transporting ATPase (P-type)
MEKSSEIKNLATALCKFQGAVETIRKNETNPFFKSKYASLSDILNVIRQPLADNGLSFVQFPYGEYGLETMLLHESGEWLCQYYKMEPSKHDPQGAGSVITYQRRYALGSILGLNIDVDDDANSASERDEITIQQLGYAEELVRKSTLDEDKKERAYKALSEKELSLAGYTAIVNKLKDAQPKKF